MEQLIKTKPQRRDEIRKLIDKNLQEGMMKSSFYTWKWILVCRLLQTKWENISEILDNACMHFSILDLGSRFHQIELDPRDMCKIPFSIDRSLWICVYAIWTKNEPSTFQRVMDSVLKDWIGYACLAYLDDIIVNSTPLQEHILLRIL